MNEKDQGVANNRVASSIACHSAVRAGDTLKEKEMNILITELGATTNPETCPHGRPTMLHLSKYNLEREFGRK